MDKRITDRGVSPDLLPLLGTTADNWEAADMGPIEATVQILSSQAIRFGDVGSLLVAIKEVHATILALPKPETAAVAEPEPVKLEPAVPIRKSVTPDFIFCLEDGKKFKSLKRHLMTQFQMTPEDYRVKWGLPDDYPMVAPNYAAIRSQLAKDNGLGKKPS